MWNRIKQAVRWGWRGVEVWSVLSALGVISVLRALLHNVFGGWAWYNQLFLFGGMFLLMLGIVSFVLRNRTSPNQGMGVSGGEPSNTKNIASNILTSESEIEIITTIGNGTQIVNIKHFKRNKT